MSDAGAMRALWLLPACSLGLGVATVALTFQAPSSRTDPLSEVVLTGVTLVAWAAVGAVILLRLSRHPVGWIVALLGVVGAVATTGESYAAVEPALPARDWVYWASSMVGSTVPALFALLMLVFPNGHFLSPRWRLVGVVTVVVAASSTVIGALSAYSAAGSDSEEWSHGEPWLHNPLPVSFNALAPLWGLVWVTLLVCLVLAAGSFALRFRRGRPDERQKLKLMLFPLGLVVAGFVAMMVVGEDGTSWLLGPGLLAVPVAIGVAILRHSLFDIDVLIRRSVVYGFLSLAISAVYVVLAAMPGLVVGDRLPLAVAVGVTVVATLAFQPARRLVDRTVGRLLFGERPTEFQLLTRFGETVSDTTEVADLAPRVAESVRQGLDLEWARVGLSVGEGRAEPAGAAGIGLDEPASATLVVPLTHGDQQVGTVECGPKREGGFTERDHELLASLARQAALGIHNARLAAELAARLDEIGRQAAELQASRSRLVTAQDNERQRLERDLHDGVQQDVVSLLARLGLARSQLRRDPAHAESILNELQTQTGRLLRDLRQLAQGIRPPVLTDRGLLEALEARLSRLSIGVHIHADPALRGRRFDPDLEAAAYFFVSEGLANAMKHAAPTRVSVALAVENGQLAIEVADDGDGFQPANGRGSGLTGLRDRIEAVGGVMQVVSSPGAGCQLSATIPVAHDVAHEAP
jgi:signal transduction histidine kinase